MRAIIKVLIYQKIANERLWYVYNIIVLSEGIKLFKLKFYLF